MILRTGPDDPVIAGEAKELGNGSFTKSMLDPELWIRPLLRAHELIIKSEEESAASVAVGNGIEVVTVSEY